MFDNYLNLQKKERRLRKKKEGRLPRLKSLQHLAEVLAAGRQDKWVGSGERVIKSLGKNIQTGFTWATDLQHSEWHLLSLSYPDVEKFQLLVNVRFGWPLTASKIVIHLSKNLQLQGKVFLVSFPPESKFMEMFIHDFFFATTLSKINYLDLKQYILL